MPDAASTEPIEALLGTANAAGFRVSRFQLRRWQQAGLLPEPKQSGLGRGRGTVVLYPAGTSSQLFALCAQLKRKRSLPVAAWHLWWDGFSIPDARIRETLREMIVDWDERREGLRVLKERDDPEVEEAWARIGKWGRGRLADPELRRIRKRTGRDRFPTFYLLLTEIGAGAFDGWSDPTDGETLAKGLGFSRTAPYRSTEKRSEFLARLQNIFRGLSEVLQPQRLRSVLDSSSAEDLRATRDEVVACLDLLDPFLALLATVIGEDVRAFLNRIGIGRTPLHFKSQQGLLLLWLSVRQEPRTRAPYQLMLSAARSIAAGESVARVITDLDAQEPKR